MLAIAQPGQDDSLIHTVPENRRVITSQANDTGHYSSGRERLRLKLSAIDHINKFAVALLEDYEAPHNSENEKWVYLYSENGPVKALVLSIVNRLFITAKDVCDLAAASSDTSIEFNPLNTALEDRIQEIIETYERKVGIVKRFLNHVLTDEFYDNIQESALKFIYEDLESIHDDPEIEAICKTTEEYFLKTDFSNFGKLDICLHIEKFRTKISELDRNFILEAPVHREKITDVTSCGNNPIVIENYSWHDVRVGLNLGHKLPSSHGCRYAVETDGYSYSAKPEITKQHVPYSADGKIWVLLDTHLLSLYFGLDPEEIEKAASAGDNQLNDLLEKQFVRLNKGVLYHEFKENATLTLELSPEIFKFLDLPDLNALLRVNRQYKPDIDLAMLPIARQNGYEGCDPHGAYTYLKQRFEDLCDEVEMLCDMGIYPRRKIVYNNLIFDKEVLPKETFRNFKTFKAQELFELFKNERLYIPFFSLISSDFIKKRGKETLMLAAIHGASDVIEKMLNRGVDVHSRNSKGDTPLHLAAKYAHEEAIKVLLNHKADVNLLNDSGESPLCVALKNTKGNFAAIFDLLRDS